MPEVVSHEAVAAGPPGQCYFETMYQSRKLAEAGNVDAAELLLKEVAERLAAAAQAATDSDPRNTPVDGTQSPLDAPVCPLNSREGEFSRCDLTVSALASLMLPANGVAAMQYTDAMARTMVPASCHYSQFMGTYRERRRHPE